MNTAVAIALHCFTIENYTSVIGGFFPLDSGGIFRFAGDFAIIYLHGRMEIILVEAL